MNLQQIKIQKAAVRSYYAATGDLKSPACKRKLAALDSQARELAKVVTRTVQFRRSVRRVDFTECDKKFGHSRLIGTAKVENSDHLVEVFRTQKSYCARVKAGRLYLHYFDATPGRAFAGATRHL